MVFGEAWNRWIYEPSAYETRTHREASEDNHRWFCERRAESYYQIHGVVVSTPPLCVDFPFVPPFPPRPKDFYGFYAEHSVVVLMRNGEEASEEVYWCVGLQQPLLVVQGPQVSEKQCEGGVREFASTVDTLPARAGRSMSPSQPSASVELVRLVKEVLKWERNLKQ